MWRVATFGIDEEYGKGLGEGEPGEPSEPRVEEVLEGFGSELVRFSGPC